MQSHAALNLSNKDLKSTQIINVVTTLLKHPTITSLNLDRNAIGDEGAKILAAEICKNKILLTELSINNNQLSDDGVVALSQIPNLLKLSLKCNSIGDECTVSLLKHPSIQELNLSNNDITNHGARILATSHRLIHLDLSLNSIGNDGAAAFGNNQSIEVLDLSHNEDINDHGAQYLLKNSDLVRLKLQGTSTSNQMLSTIENRINSNHAQHAIRKKIKATEKFVNDVRMLTTVNLHSHHPLSSIPMELLLNIFNYAGESAGLSHDEVNKLSQRIISRIEDQLALIENKLNRKKFLLNLALIGTANPSDQNNHNLVSKLPPELISTIFQFIGENLSSQNEVKTNIEHTLGIASQKITEKKFVKDLAVFEKAVKGPWSQHLPDGSALPVEMIATIFSYVGETAGLPIEQVRKQIDHRLCGGAYSLFAPAKQKTTDASPGPVINMKESEDTQKSPRKNHCRIA